MTRDDAMGGDERHGERRPRLLFVLSSDFGELFNASYMVLGRHLEASFLMPQRMFQLNRATFAGNAMCYRSARELDALVRQQRPDLVALFSGYLFVVNKLIDLGSLQTVLASWRADGIQIVTSDPTLGIAASVGPDTVDSHHPRHAWLTRHLTQIYDVLAATPHVYLAPTGPLPHPHVSFFNPELLLSADALAQCGTVVRKWSEMHPQRPRWLFVLSPEDYGIQLEAHGRERFTELLVDQLRAATDQGRQPVLLAPPQCTADVGRDPRRPDGLAMLVACNLNLFLALLYEAEHVFYWNMFSASILGRALNRRSFFLFDVGHLTRYLRPFRDRGADQLYPGCVPPFLDPARHLDAGALARLAAGQAGSIHEPALRHFSASPSPEEVLAALLPPRAP